MGVIVVMMVMVVHVTEVRIDETVSLNLSGWLKVKMLRWVMHSLKVTPVARGFGSVMVMMLLRLRILFRLLLLFERLLGLWHFFIGLGLRWSANLRRLFNLLWLFLSHFDSFLFLG